MKTSIAILKVLVAVLLILNLLFWMMAHASGHKIPVETNVSCAVTALILFGALFFLYFFGLKFKSKAE